MKTNWRSLKFKVLVLLTIIPVAILSLFIVFVVKIFSKDKVSYVFETNTSTARSIASQLRIQSESLIESLKPIIEGFEPTSGQLSPTSQEIYSRKDNIPYFAIYRWDPKGQPVKILDLKKNSDFEINNIFASPNQTRHLIRDAFVHAFSLSRSKIPNQIALSFHTRKENQDWIFVALFDQVNTADLFEKYTAQEHALFNEEGKVLLSSNEETNQPLLQQILQDETSLKKMSQVPEGAFEFNYGKSQHLVSFANTGVGGLKVLTFVDQSSTLSAVRSLVYQSGLFFLTVLSLALIISVFASRKLTGQLLELSEATEKISHGDFDVNIQIQGKDEVAFLAGNFNKMASEISNLIAIKEEGARREAELKTAKLVQETLIPDPVFKTKNVELAGFYQSASETGGDWWHYFEHGDYVYLWIADVTGHGAAAAMLTSAAKSAATIIEKMPDITTAKALQIMNQAIHETSKGTLMMTLFLGALNKRTGLIQYSNASHEPPIHWNKEMQPTLRDVGYLNEVSNPHVGRDLDTEYEQKTFQLEDGDILLFYTDGVWDIRNKNDEPLGERKFFSLLNKTFSRDENVQQNILKLTKEINTYRENSPLNDDITFFMIRYQKGA